MEQITLLQKGMKIFVGAYGLSVEDFDKIRTYPVTLLGSGAWSCENENLPKYVRDFLMNLSKKYQSNENLYKNLER